MARFSTYMGLGNWCTMWWGSGRVVLRALIWLGKESIGLEKSSRTKRKRSGKYIFSRAIKHIYTAFYEEDSASSIAFAFLLGDYSLAGHLHVLKELIIHFFVGLERIFQAYLSLG